MCGYDIAFPKYNIVPRGPVKKHKFTDRMGSPKNEILIFCAEKE
jgi:hypothetical protein